MFLPFSLQAISVAPYHNSNTCTQNQPSNQTKIPSKNPKKKPNKKPTQTSPSPNPVLQIEERAVIHMQNISATERVMVL